MFLLLPCCVLLSLPFLLASSASISPAASYLLQFRSSLPKSSQHLLPWNKSDSPSHCQWPGVSCYSNDDPEVKSLNLSGYGLSGILANSISHVCSHKHLLSLDLSINNFTGGIPQLLGNCSRLSTILLNDNGLQGSIPAQIFSKQLLELNLGTNLLWGTIPSEVRLCRNLEYLGLYNNFLSGEIPRELFSLPKLKFLYLNTNNLTGTLPNFPPSCAISDLWIHENALSGSLPHSLGNCRNLTMFFASYNNFGGIIPPEIFKGLVQLEFLYLDSNKLEGQIPETLWGLGELKELVLSGNMLNGRIPERIAQCHQLAVLSLSTNNLVGQIPPSIGSLKDLYFVSLSDNMLQGSLPPEVGNCSSLVELRLQNNLIEGRIPSEVCKLENLEVFHLFNNHIKGRIPQQIGRMSNLVELALYNNSLTGRIPSGITHLKKLTFLSLADNNLTGEVPSEIGRNNSPGLVKLDLTGNRLYGLIPSYICSGNSLSVLALGNNSFNGTFPVELGKCSSLRRVILSYNLLQGSIPAELDKNPGISFLDARGNLLEGSIPPVVGSWSNLSMLDLSENRLSGSIPPELGMLGNLQMLLLSSNRLNGSIPPELGYCSQMIKMDLSKNSLRGNIPSEITSFVALQNLLLQDNNLSGVIPDSFSSLESLFDLQLGNNMLEGSIPCSLGKLHQLNSVLNLSHNMLSGEIPRCLSGLDKLQILDLSSNNFSGTIPPELNSMVSLSFVNISFNHLSGKIPDAWMKSMASSPGSYLGNPELCLQGNADRDSYCGEAKNSHTKGLVLVGIILTVAFFIALLCAAIYITLDHRLRQQLSSQTRSPLHECRSKTEDLPEDLKLEDIIKATEGWNDRYVIGRGKHGTVYRTETENSRRNWAVKKVDLSETNFSIEMRTLSLVRHRNVVRMAGYCIKDGYGFIVTEYMEGGTLFDVLHWRKPLVLNWDSRYRIALGIAQGLSYLHHDCVPQIIHRDVKSDNILMDSELEPKIGDFGLAKLVSDDSDASSTMSAIVGTLGYIAPENGHSTRLTEKCDVYSYGVILLELLCRKLPVDPSFEEGLDIASWTRKNLQENNECCSFLDVEIGSWNVDEQWKALKLLELALDCTELEPGIRPSMRDVVGYLIKLNDKQEGTVHTRDNSGS
ncbi:hypothetical protein VitviT2T_025495 [Vitis vinifera]|uniref:non-specific serine/threonine protein kinase n=1 Tax=Vitis vinifera TaxID=29760 RepID=A0ABY9DLX8_VITVI|nr:leucine-rich repeat receptor-like protein kinase PEPR1 [Vitis vinifera]WKA07709.1 hypothetical protein VitviT2T_025495 [Vitis vinifera]|eukprot:XP_002271388.1 PREDICTED: leucine-rich repeat receptor-like protein kinase PEPR1 [Vitis vinifera]